MSSLAQRHCRCVELMKRQRRFQGESRRDETNRAKERNWFEWIKGLDLQSISFLFSATDLLINDDSESIEQKNGEHLSRCFSVRRWNRWITPLHHQKSLRLANWSLALSWVRSAVRCPFIGLSLGIFNHYSPKCDWKCHCCYGDMSCATIETSDQFHSHVISHRRPLSRNDCDDPWFYLRNQTEMDLWPSLL